MSFYKKYFLIFAIFLTLLVGYRTYSQHQSIILTQNKIIENQTKTLINFIKSFRKTYQDIFLEKNITIDEKTLHLLPVKTTPIIAKNFSKLQNNDIIIKTVSNRPRNPDNMANDFEKHMINFFKSHPKVEYQFIKKGASHIMVEPLYIQKTCLKCHGDKKDAFITIQKHYTTAYNYHIGDIRGLIDIEIKNNGLFNPLYIEFKNNLITNIFLLFIILIIIYILLKNILSNEKKYQDILQQEINAKTKQIAQQKDTLYYQATHDALTDLPNRTHFLNTIQQKISDAKSNNKKIALFFIDLDQFKQINDSLGHDIGDEVLKIATKRLKSKLREKDILARLGGDEFVAIIDEYKNTNNLTHIASKILDVTKEPINIQGHTLYISSSIGISTYPNDATNARDLLKFADTAMYKAKDEGRNNYQFYNKDMTKIAYEKITIKSELKNALLHDEFIICFQPQIDITNNTLLGVEALSRWNHPTKGLLLPKDYIDLAISSGVIVDIDRMMIDKSMQIISSWYHHDKNPGTLSLNITISNLIQDDFIEYLNDTMHKYDFNPNWLILEITENEVMQKHQLVSNKLQKLSDMGISITIDDFGIGYSSLAYLKQLPVSKLKIDRSFVFHVPQDQDDTSIVKAIIALAKNLNLDIMAEGVETKPQKDFLEANGCVNIQGFYYDKPMSASDIEKKYL
jgi:diguanylate cyclase (GGDEF)-like protein